MILSTTLVFASLKSMLLLKYHQLKLLNFLGFVWTSFIAHLGSKPKETLIDSKKSYKVLVFISLVSGMVVWIAYKSFLKAEFAVSLKKHPFNDMESLSKTDWRYFSLNIIMSLLDVRYSFI